MIDAPPTIKSIYATGCARRGGVPGGEITLHGEWSGDAPASLPTLAVYECQPCEAEIDLSERQPVAEVALTWADTSSGICLSLPRFDGERDRLYSRFVVVTGGGGEAADSPIPLSGVCYVNQMEGVAQWDYAYPTAPTLKGLQVNMVDDALALGIGHAALNLNQPTIMRPGPSTTTIAHRSDGRDFYFDGEYLARFDRRVKELSDHGIVVTLILLDSRHWDGVEIAPELREALLHPDYDPEGLISAFNVVTAEGLAHYKAFIEFVAERYTRPDQRYGRACGYIIGNEVDSGWVWCNAGEKTVKEYVRQYTAALRTAFYAARKQYAQARVYVSLDHLWTIRYIDNPLRTYCGRDILELLNSACLTEGNFDWSLAFHPYPQNLFHADFWHDETAQDSFDTPRITFRNIERLSQYLRKARYLYDGQQRHIILSEQGFHSDENPESERLQAAAYAYAYWKVERTAGIDSFILHAHVDNRDEFSLNLGLWRRDRSSPSGNAPGSPKPIYEVFKGIDQAGREALFAQARQVVGEENWPWPDAPTS